MLSLDGNLIRTDMVEKEGGVVWGGIVGHEEERKGGGGGGETEDIYSLCYSSPYIQIRMKLTEAFIHCLRHSAQSSVTV